MSKEEAARINGRIDEEIKKDSARQKDARRREIKVMLLGQAESGKSTLQKQFQLFYASKTLDAERRSWIPVVYYNIIKALRLIFAELDYEMTTHSMAGPMESHEVREELNSLRVRLLPLLALENTLASELSGGVSLAGGRTGAYVRLGWQNILSSTLSIPSDTRRPELENRARETTLLVARTLALAVDDIDALWLHEAIQFYIKQRKIRLEDSSSYFLRHIQRIAEPEYIPSNDDILNVRLQTLGVMEHTFPITITGKTYDWKLYDVGGAIDILRSKLDAGIKVRKYITSFGERANNFETVSDYFRSHFIQAHRRKGFPNRPLYVHFTAMLDTSAMQSIISNVAEGIMRKHIAEAGLA
ncbi:hypothetical protein CVT26_004229 [Gymnopilus dilepis]|uniref:Uncharacterized protein n=1 Tax=Gymnopilus dilepis TaxID=231916 RepID=A0A409YP46_9AGAR|nr:hypothetical protein CVT26_004229 [Gymnopilus dilepis]